MITRATQNSINAMNAINATNATNAQLIENTVSAINAQKMVLNAQNLSEYWQSRILTEANIHRSEYSQNRLKKLNACVLASALPIKLLGFDILNICAMMFSLCYNSFAKF